MRTESMQRNSQLLTRRGQLLQLQRQRLTCWELRAASEHLVRRSTVNDELHRTGGSVDGLA